MSMDNKKTVEVGEVIDSAHYFWVPFGITVMMVIIMLTDGFGLFTTGYIGPHIVKDWGIGRDQLSWLGYTQMGGMALGSVLLGWISDRIGRKKAYFSCLALLFVGSLLCYSAGQYLLAGGLPLRHWSRAGRHHPARHHPHLRVDAEARAQPSSSPA